MKNKTAMQEFSEWLLAFEYELPLELQVKAKECLVREKEQIIDAFHDGCLGEMYKLNAHYTAEKYYNETYNC